MATDTDTTSVYTELIEFLKSSRDDVRLAAIQAVQQVTDRHQISLLLDADVLPPLVKACSYNEEQISIAALQALIYLSSSTGPLANKCQLEMIGIDVIPRLVENVLTTTTTTTTTSTNRSRQRINFSLALLANVTRMEQGALDLVGKTLPDHAVYEKSDDEGKSSPPPTLVLMLERFLNEEYILAKDEKYYQNLIAMMDEEQGNEVDDDEIDSDEKIILSKKENYQRLESHDQDPYQHFAAVLMNITQIEAGRKFVMRIPKKDSNSNSNSNPKSVLQRLVTQLLKSPNPLRRRGIAGTIRNCCLDTNAAWWLLNEVKLVEPGVLYPLAGPEELDTMDEKHGMHVDLWIQGPDKVREVDTMTRLWCVEAVLLLCASGRASRDKLRKAQSYVILKNADLVEESETVSERISECVQFLRRDEEGTTEGSSDALAEREIRSMTAANSSGDGGAAVGDYDGVD